MRPCTRGRFDFVISEVYGFAQEKSEIHFRPMSVSIGSMLGHFKITAKLGEGGMGEIWRAQDTELDREVALKVLPPDYVGNEERLSRFVREAKSASALAHPNIITIYEIGKQEVATDEGDSRDVHYIAMELVDGLTLKQHIHDRRTDLKTLLGYLGQAAQGLARAHEAGVVHRDLKPDNVMITQDGFAKVLDFGLAKLNVISDPGEGVTSAPTLADDATREGVMMGTVGYMSPEQAQGSPAVDHRTDIFSFGCLLYEAATRRRPFVADTSIDTLHQILHDDPAAMEDLNPDVPGALRRVVKRCLAKDPARRAQSMRDLALELSELVDEFDSLAPASALGSTIAAVAATPPPKPRRNWALGLGAVAVAVIAVVLIWSMRGSRPLPATDGGDSSGGFQAMEIEPLTADGTITNAALSPDGRYLAHTRAVEGKTGLWIRQVATGSNVPIVAPEDVGLFGLVFAPDGEHLYFLRRDPEQAGFNALFKVPTLGGEARRILFDVDSGVTFSPDQSRIAFPRGMPHQNRTVLLVAEADGSGERELVSLTSPDRFLLARPAWSPDGTVIVAAMHTADDLLTFRFTVIEVESGTMSPLAGEHRFARMSAVEWLPDGSGLIVVGRRSQLDAIDQIWLIELPGGEIRRVSNDLNSYRGASVSADGSTLATVSTETVTQLYVVAADDPADVRQLTSGPREKVYDLVAAPGDKVIVQRRRLDQIQLWEMSAAGEEPRRLTSDGTFFSQAISDDGTLLLACVLFEDERPHVWRIDSQTGTRLEQLTSGDGEVNLALSPAGDWLLYGRLGNRALWQRDLASAEERLVVENYRGSAEISPDGESFALFAFADDGGQSRRVIEIRSREGRLERTLPWDQGQDFYWHPDGEAFVGVRSRERVSNLWRVPLDGSEPTQITEFDRGFIVDADWSPDGEWLYVTRGENTSDVVLVRNFR